MLAIVPAAGLGTRMLPFSALAAKELLPIGTRPVIQWVLEEALAVGASGAVVVLSPHKRSLRSYLEGYQRPAYAEYEESLRWQKLLEDLPVTIVEQPQPTGLGDALLRGREASEDGEWYLMYPDNIVTDCILLYDSLGRLFKESGFNCIACKDDKPYFRGNNFVVAGEQRGDGRLVAAVTRRDAPRPEGKLWRAAGRVLVNDDYFAALARARGGAVGSELDDLDAYEPLLAEGRLVCLPPCTPIYDAGCTEGYYEAWQAMLAGRLKFPGE